MALTPAAMMNLRRGPTSGPQPTPGGVPGAGPGGAVPSAGLPANPAMGEPGNLLMTAIAQRMSESKKANANFATSHLAQIKRVLGTMQTFITQMHPSAARHLNKAWASIDAAEKDLNDFAKEQGQTGGPLGFSGAQIGPTQAGPPGGGGGGGMGVPS